MKLLLPLLVIVLLAIAARFGVQQLSGKKTPPAPQNGQLAPCPDTPNCYTETVELDQDGALALEKIEKQIEGMSGVSIEERKTGYLHATFKSRLMGYTDDVQVLQTADNRLQLRSASRLGHSDFGVNKKRIEKLLLDSGIAKN